MGMSTAGVFIKLDAPELYDLDKVATELFGPFEARSDQWYSGFDFRQEKYKVISQCEQGIKITSAEFVNEILIKGRRELIDILYKMFDQPKVIVCFMHFESGDTFGFRYIEDGITKRYRYKWSGMQTIEDGTPLPEELKVLNAELFYEGDIDDEFLCYRLENGTGSTDAYHFISSALASEVTKARIGFDFKDDAVECKSSYYQYKEKKIESASEGSSAGFFTRVFGKKK